MQGLTLIFLGASFVAGVSGCSGGDSAPGSTIDQPKAGSAGSGGGSGSLSLGVGGGGAGAGAGGGGSGGSAGAAIGIAGASAGTPQGGIAGQAGSVGSGGGGSSSGGSGSGGSKAAGTCKRAAASDADCVDFGDGMGQAYACDDPSAYVALNAMHGSNCLSVNFVTGSKYGACCPP